MLELENSYPSEVTQEPQHFVNYLLLDREHWTILYGRKGDNSVLAATTMKAMLE